MLQVSRKIYLIFSVVKKKIKKTQQRWKRDKMKEKHLSTYHGSALSIFFLVEKDF